MKSYSAMCGFWGAGQLVKTIDFYPEWNRIRFPSVGHHPVDFTGELMKGTTVHLLSQNVLLDMPADVRANLIAKVRLTMQITAGEITEAEVRPELERL